MNKIFKRYNTNITIDYYITTKKCNINDLTKDDNEIISNNLLIAIINYTFSLVDNKEPKAKVMGFNNLARELKFKIRIISYYDKYKACLGGDDKSETIDVINQLFAHVCKECNSITYNQKLNRVFAKHGSNMKRITVDGGPVLIKSDVNNVTIDLVIDLLNCYIINFINYNYAMEFNDFAKHINSKVRIANYEEKRIIMDMKL